MKINVLRDIWLKREATKINVEKESRGVWVRETVKNKKLKKEKRREDDRRGGSKLGSARGYQRE